MGNRKCVVVIWLVGVGEWVGLGRGWIDNGLVS